MLSVWKRTFVEAVIWVMAVAVAGFGVVMLSGGPAHGGLWDDALVHYAPDKGYDAPIAFKCKGRTWQLPEGWNSMRFCDGDVTHVWVGSRQEIVCAFPTLKSGVYDWRVVYDKDRTWHEVHRRRVCVIGLD